MGSPCNKEMVEAINDPPSVQIMVVHHEVQCPHGPFEDAGVLLPLLFPFPIVNTPSQCFFEDQLNLSSTAIGQQELDVFSVIEQRTLSEELEGKDGFSKVSVGHVSDVALDPYRWIQRFQLTDGLQTLLNHQAGKGGHSHVLCSASQGFNDSRGSMSSEDETGAPAAFLHHSPQVGLARLAQVVCILDDDDA